MVKINDLVDSTGKFKTCQQFCTETGKQINFYQYMSLIDAIPRKWRQMLKLQNVDQRVCRPNEGIILTLHNKSIQNVHSVKSKEIYWFFINENLILPTCINSWNLRLNINYDVNNWKPIFVLPFQCTNNPQLRDMQIKILHRFYPCKSIIAKFDKNTQDKCNLCGDANANIKHTFCDCTHTENFWLHLSNLLVDILSLYVNSITCNNSIFGILPYTIGNHAVNHCILYGKYFIHIKHCTKKIPNFADFKKYYAEVLSIERELYVSKNDLKTFHTLFDRIYTLFV